jgi:hypothetical protein
MFRVHVYTGYLQCTSTEIKSLIASHAVNDFTVTCDDLTVAGSTTLTCPNGSVWNRTRTQIYSPSMNYTTGLFNFDTNLDVCLRLPATPYLNNTNPYPIMSSNSTSSKINFTFTCQDGYGTGNWFKADTQLYECEPNTDMTAYKCVPELNQFCFKIPCDATVSASKYNL